VKWPVGDHTVDATRIDRLSPAEHITIVYDSKTGMGLHLASVSQTGADSGSILMEYDVVGYRDLKIPWAGEPIPAAAKSMKSMKLTGTTVRDAIQKIRPIGVTVDITAETADPASDRWLAFSTVGTLTIPGIPPAAGKPVKSYQTTNDFGGLWIGPTAAAKLTAGQVLDEDPNTKTKTVVSAVDNGTVTITQSNTATQAKYVYDKSTGLLAGSEWFDGLTRYHTTTRREELK
jgi:hypothetical protein